MRAAMCVIVRDLIVFGVLTDMMRGRPAVYATFSSYDEVAHHSGLERADTLEALRKLDQQFDRIARARRHAPRPYEIVVLSDHGQTQGATFKQRHGYGLDDARRAVAREGRVAGSPAATSSTRWSGQAVAEATGRQAAEARPKNDVSDRQVVVLGSGNLGLIYLMDEPRAAHARGDRRAPPAAASRPARAPAHRLAARALGGAGRGGARPARHALPGRGPGRGRGPARRVLGPTRGASTCCAPTASRTSPTSWSAASTTPTWTRAARSRS